MVEIGAGVRTRDHAILQCRQCEYCLTRKINLCVAIRTTVDWYTDRRINIDDLITHVLPFGRINRGFGLMRRGKASAAS